MQNVLKQYILRKVIGKFFYSCEKGKMITRNSEKELPATINRITALLIYFSMRDRRLTTFA
jgi:hypothetical protein